MLIPFENMPDNARVWIYQSDKKLTDADKSHIEGLGRSFCEGWAAHGAPLKCSFRIFHDQFLIITVDESHNMASGCSIDASVHFVKQLESDLQINFFDRTKVAFVLNEEVFLEPLSQLKSKVDEGTIQEDTLTFNNLVSVKGELASAWMVPAKSTWLGRYFN
ncbi:hypothetical protein C900_00895 [Fulvivirga imtechensis AK7]|uniref:ABC transporter ATPase n=1 Tax=Fulvivirga imtechensis AK7 TaxID=1237149 RepID=L8JZ58_9BACT|nr:hypothetical protein [Fulvivirga imtechensis]ELR72934.1 hypothetical protein C900_00895 [Fulvivirga imtechensis AK7]